MAIYIGNPLTSDIKLQNILYLEKSPHSLIKIIDYGLSYKMGKSENEPLKTEKMIGTPMFMSYEMMIGNFCKKSDMYSLGVIMYYLLSGRMPFSVTRKGNADHINEEIFSLMNRGIIDYSVNGLSSLSSQGVELLTLMMSNDYNARPSASQALQHPWFHSIASLDNISMPNIETVLNKLFEYTPEENVLIYAVKIMMAKISEKTNIAKLFIMLDNNSDGIIGVEDLNLIKKKYGIENVSHKFSAYRREKGYSYSDLILSQMDKSELRNRESISMAVDLLFAIDAPVTCAVVTYSLMTLGLYTGACKKQLKSDIFPCDRKSIKEYIYSSTS